MKKSTKAVIVGAAMAGLFTGAAARVQATTVVNGSAGASINVMDDTSKDSDKNSCKGQNSCKGKGGCATDGSKKSSN